ncbi:MAG: stimulus-sensing domain-containing protein [Hyphomicrobiaceae bacterium]
MALEWQTIEPGDQRSRLGRLRERVNRLFQPLSGGYLWLRKQFKATPIGRFFGQSLARRIFFSNVLGLLVLLFGIFWVSQQHALLITAKRENLQIQGEIIAAAIGASARVHTNDITFDPNRLNDVGPASIVQRTDAFAALDGLELSLRPEEVGPVLRRLIEPVQMSTRARIYDRGGALIVDTNRASMGDFGSSPGDDRSSGKPKVKTLWTRILSVFDGTDLPLYYEIGTANGTYYREVRQALKGERPPPMLLLSQDHHQIVSLAIPIQRRKRTLGVLLISTKPGEIERILARERWIFLSVASMALLTTLAASMQLTRSIAEPVRHLAATAMQVSKSISARTQLPDFSDRRDEVGHMARAFREMTSALYRRIEASEKFAADVAHELKNPLAAARSTAESMSFAKTDEQRQMLAEQIQSELKRLNRLITDVSNASRLDAELARQETEVLDLSQTLKGLIDVLGDIHGSRGKTIRFEVMPDRSGDTSLLVMGHEGRLGQVVTNLVDNAASFSPQGGIVTVHGRRVDNEIEISVEDQGPGIPANKLDAIFGRFYSDRPESDSTIGKNSGLGLSISREIINAHGGHIWAENRVEAANGETADANAEARVIGARFAFRLPAAIPSTAARPARRPANA